MTEKISDKKLENNKDEKSKKHNKTFSIRPDHVAFLESVDRKSAFLEMLIEGYRKGQFIKAETAELLNKYKTLFGADPENVIKKILVRKVERIERNMEALKDSAPAEVKNRVGGAFLKLNRAYDALVTENETLENKLAITFGLMFKKTGCNHQSIRGWIRANKQRIDQYHQSIGISDPSIHNRQVGVIKRVKWQKAESEAEKNVKESDKEKQEVEVKKAFEIPVQAIPVQKVTKVKRQKSAKPSSNKIKKKEGIKT